LLAARQQPGIIRIVLIQVYLLAGPYAILVHAV
jgi:hypothetical protein